MLRRIIGCKEVLHVRGSVAKPSCERQKIMGQAAIADAAQTLLKPRVKPRLRGHSHALAAVVALPAALLLLWHARPGLATAVSAVYGLSVLGLFCTSATYHTFHWEPQRRAWLGRWDHTMIYVLIAGTYTPVCALALEPPYGHIMLAAVWTVAAFGAAKTFLWEEAPRGVNVVVYMLMGWMVALVGPALLKLGWPLLTGLGLGGVFYSVGALVYARRWPDPAPAVFGYHEIFHLFVIAAAALHFALIWGVVG